MRGEANRSEERREEKLHGKVDAGRRKDKEEIVGGGGLQPMSRSSAGANVAEQATIAIDAGEQR